jgi:hypothetical protein
MNAPQPPALESAVAKASLSSEFTAEEVEALRAVADAWRGFEALGRVARVAQRVAIYVGWLVGAYLAVKFTMGEWVKGLK